ncbi:MAG: urease accessory protein UreD [Paracoccaceae bacterium]
MLFPRGRPGVEACLVNTAGGITGGDRFSVRAEARPGARLTLSTQAAERAYRAQPGQSGRLDVALSAAPDAVLHWLPQETILYEGCALTRSLRIALAPGARLLMVEPVLFGRMAMGELLRAASFRDRVEITREGAPIYLDAVRLEGDITAQLARPAVADGAGAMAVLVLVAPEAEAHLSPVRALLPETGGASLLAHDLLVLRILAADAMALRRSLLPVLDRLSGDTLPTAWRL